MNHAINVFTVRSGRPGYSDTIIECSCGLEKRIHSRWADSPEVEKAILYHRIASIEEEIGINVGITFGQNSND